MSGLKSRIGSKLIPMLPVNRRTFDILRHEFVAFRVTFFNYINPWHHLWVRRIRKTTGLSVNLGSGGKGLSNWINIEIRKMKDTDVCLDIRRRLPFADNSVSRIFAEHVIEHVDFRNDVPMMFADWYRILKPGGSIRIIVPDLQRYLTAYVESGSERWIELGWDLSNLPDDIYTPMHIVNHQFHQGGEHLFGYDFDTMKFVLEKTGFRSIEKMKFGESNDSQLAIDQENHRKYSLYVEAKK